MTFTRSISIIAAALLTTVTTTGWAATDNQHDGHHPAAAAAVQLAQATPGNPGMGMGGIANMQGLNTKMNAQMQAMQAMHSKFMAAKTPEERNALIPEQMTLMQNGMGMIGPMGAGAMPAQPGEMTARQGLLEQRMEMMQSMMQMMMDRMSTVPPMK